MDLSGRLASEYPAGIHRNTHRLLSGGESGKVLNFRLFSELVMACLRGFEPPTFGSGVHVSTLLDIWGKPDFQEKMPCFTLRTISQN